MKFVHSEAHMFDPNREIYTGSLSEKNITKIYPLLMIEN